MKYKWPIDRLTPEQRKHLKPSDYMREEARERRYPWYLPKPGQRHKANWSDHLSWGVVTVFFGSMLYGGLNASLFSEAGKAGQVVLWLASLVVIAPLVIWFERKTRRRVWWQIPSQQGLSRCGGTGYLPWKKPGQPPLKCRGCPECKSEGSK